MIIAIVLLCSMSLVVPELVTRPTPHVPTTIADSDRFSRWFPLKTARRSTRLQGAEIYHERQARCNRLRDSPVFYMQRRLNGKVGKTYGKRNQFWRER